MSSNRFRVLLLTVSLFVAKAASPVAAVAQRALTPPLVRLIDDLGSPANSVAPASTGLTYFINDDGIHAYDPVRRTSFVVDSSPAVDIAVSPKGDRLAFGRGDPMFTIWTLQVNPATGRAVAPARRVSLTFGRAPAFSPDGRSIAFSVLPASDSVVGPRIVRVPSSGGPEQVLSREPGYAQRLRWSPDGRWIYYRHGMMTAAGRVRTVNRVAATGGAPEALAPAGEFIGLSPDGRRLAYVTNIHFHLDTLPKGLVIADALGRQLQRVDLPSDVRPEAWGPAPEQLHFLRTVGGRSVSTVRLTDLNGRVHELTPRGASEHFAGNSPDGKSILLETYSGERRDLISLDLASGTRRLVFSDTGTHRRVQWHNERFLALVSGEDVVDLVDRTTRRERRLGQCASMRTPLPRDSTVLCLQRSTGVREIVAVRLADGERRMLRRFTVPEQDGLSVVIAGRDQIVLSYRGRVMMSPLSGTPQRTAFVASQGVEAGNDVVPSPDGTWLAFTVDSVDGEGHPRAFLRLVSPRNAAIRSLPIPALRPVSPLYWDPAGRYISVVAEDGPRRDMWVFPLNGAPAFALTRTMPSGGAWFTLAGDGNGVISESTTAANLATAIWAVDLSPLLARAER